MTIIWWDIVDTIDVKLNKVLFLLIKLSIVCSTVTSLYVTTNRTNEKSSGGNWKCMITSSNGNIFRVTVPLCGEFTGPGEFPAQRPVTWSFSVFFDLRLNKRLSKQWRGRWFKTLSHPFWRHRNDYGIYGSLAWYTNSKYISTEVLSWMATKNKSLGHT